MTLQEKENYINEQYIRHAHLTQYIQIQINKTWHEANEFRYFDDYNKMFFPQWHWIRDENIKYFFENIPFSKILSNIETITVKELKGIMMYNPYKILSNEQFQSLQLLKEMI